MYVSKKIEGLQEDGDTKIFAFKIFPTLPPPRQKHNGPYLSVRYLFYQPMDENIKTWTLRFPAKETPKMEKAWFECSIVSQLWLPLIPIRQLTVFSRISDTGVKISAKRSGAHQVFL